MCWIWLIPKKDLYPTLANQKVRWLDWIGIIDFKQWELLKAFKAKSLVAYEDYINNTFKKDDDMCFIHHRAASVWAVSIDNTHPFVWEKFLLAQNWTSKDLYAELAPIYWAETDSECLLWYLEDWCDTLEECIDLLDTIEDTLWIICLFHKGRILIYSDSCRWSYLDIYDVKFKKKKTKSYLRSFTNFKAHSSSEYKNWFYMILDSKTFEILDEWNYDWDVYNVDTWYSYVYNWNKASKKTRKTKEDKTWPWFAVIPKANAHALLASKPKKKWTLADFQTIVDETSLKNNKLLTTITNASIMYGTESLLSPEDTSELITDYWLATNINPATLVTLWETLFNFMCSEKDYEETFSTADSKVFNSASKKQKLHIDFLFLVPLKYLSAIVLLNQKIVRLNLVRHSRYITTLNPSDLLYYLFSLEYFVDYLSFEKLWVKLQALEYNYLTLDSFLHLIYDETLPKTQDLPYFHSTADLSDPCIKWFVRAWYALGLKPSDLNVSPKLYMSITSKFEISWEKK